MTATGPAGLRRYQLAVGLLALIALLLSTGNWQQRQQQPGQTASVADCVQQPFALHRGIQNCKIDPTGSPFEQHCVALRDVCVDEGAIILHEPQYQQLGMRPPQEMPNLDSPGPWGIGIKYRFPWVVGGVKRGSEVEAEMRLGPPPPAANRQRRSLRYVYMDPTLDSRQVPLPLLRPASSQEPRPYLAAPTFSSCTLPVVWRPMWQDNLHHAFRDMGSQLLSALEATPWRQHIKLIALTPDGLAQTPAMGLILGTLTNMSVETWAEFSRRLPWDGGSSGQAHRRCYTGPPPGPLGLRPPSYEGGDLRCFRHLYFCGNGTVGTPAAQFRLGQLMMGQLAAAGLLPPAPRPCTGACKFREAKGQAVTLRLVFHKRLSWGRRLLNTAELLQRCRSWRLQDKRDNTLYRLTCTEVELKDLASGAAAARGADIFVGMHGANLQNAMLLAPGASVVELVPYEYDRTNWGPAMAQFNMQDPTTQLLWWSIVNCDAALSEPGIVEVAGVYDTLEDKSSNYPRNRSLRLTWAALEEVLRRIVAVRGDFQRYRQEYWDSGGWRLHMWADSQLSAPGNSNEQLLCPSRQPA